MGDCTMWTYIIPGVCSILVAWVEARANADRKAAKADKEHTERREARRSEETRLSMELANATCKCALVTAKAVTNQHLNGDVEDAMQEAEEAQGKYQAFIVATAAKQCAKA